MPMTTRGAGKGAGFWKGSTTTGRSKKTVKITTSVRPKVPKGAAKAGIVSLMKKMISQGEETKYVALNNFTPLQPVLVPAGASSPINSMLPILSQGTDDWQRIGEQIQPTAASVNFRFQFIPEVNATEDLTVVLYILTYKKVKSFPLAIADPTVCQFLDNGQGAAQFFQPNNEALGPPAVYDCGAQISAMMPIHKSTHTLLKKKVFRFVRNQGVTDFDATPSATPNIRANHHEYTYKFKKLPKLKYEDNHAQYPSNFAPFALAYVYTNSGRALATPSPIGWSMRSNLYFKDS
ncbi:coat protein [Lake Sarah-associated circular virus-21]|uniref:coat protein n=1 Tax=Lake Sarah-associated circular virus-21 TaxID=1685748 RepID=UPI00077746BF|nr:coat protein [Lake Sarah-associated circular virus-21]ALE29665.1 coat protein [Lake Sarah-associated circular virus-21]